MNLLDEITKLYLDSLDDTKTHSIFYFGIPTGLMEDHMIALANQKYKHYFSNADALKYKFDVKKTSEFLDGIIFNKSSDYSNPVYNDALHVDKNSFRDATRSAMPAN